MVMIASVRFYVAALLLGALFLPALIFAEEVATTSSSTTDVASSTVATPAPSTQPDNKRVTLSPVAQTRITNLTANISNRLDAHLRRLDNVTSRLDSRIGKLNAEGKDTALAASSLNSAKADLDTARNMLATIDSEVATFVGSETPYERWRSLKATYSNIYTNLTSAHDHAITCILLLQGAQEINVETSTSTATSTSE
jgi:hypothetical protein